MAKTISPVQADRLLEAHIRNVLGVQDELNYQGSALYLERGARHIYTLSWGGEPLREFVVYAGGEWVEEMLGEVVVSVAREAEERLKEWLVEQGFEGPFSFGANKEIGDHFEIYSTAIRHYFWVYPYGSVKDVDHIFV